MSRRELLSHQPGLRPPNACHCFLPGLAQEPSNVECFRENFQRNGLGEEFLFLKGCIKKVWVNTKSPKADRVGLQTWHRGTLRGGCHLPQHCLRAPERETSWAKRQNWVKAGSQPWHWGGRTAYELLSRRSCQAPARGQAPCLPRRRSTGPPSPQKMNEDIGIQSDQATGVGCAP